MTDPQAIADRVQIEALRGEATGAAMMRDYDPWRHCSPTTATAWRARPPRRRH